MKLSNSKQFNNIHFEVLTTYLLMKKTNNAKCVHKHIYLRKHSLLLSYKVQKHKNFIYCIVLYTIQHNSYFIATLRTALFDYVY